MIILLTLQTRRLRFREDKSHTQSIQRVTKSQTQICLNPESMPMQMLRGLSNGKSHRGLVDSQSTFLGEMTYDLGLEEWVPKDGCQKGMEQGPRGNYLSEGEMGKNTVDMKGLSGSIWLEHKKKREIKWKGWLAWDYVLCSSYYVLPWIPCCWHGMAENEMRSVNSIPEPWWGPRAH